MAKYSDLSQKQVMELFHCDPEKGSLTWKSGVRKHLIGILAGNIDNTGYYRLGYRRKTKLQHRLIWIYTHGEIPDGLVIDHVNGVRHDNRISNLRVVTSSTNSLNLQGPHIDSKTGFLGVTLHKGGKYQAQLDSKYLGLFDRPEDAHSAYLKAVLEYTK